MKPRRAYNLTPTDILEIRAAVRAREALRTKTLAEKYGLPKSVIDAVARTDASIFFEIREAVKARRALRSKELAQHYGCSPGTIAAIATGRRYAGGGL